MTRAREVLADCELALADFEAAGPTPYWRTRWTGLVSLLRCVGHVLHKVDAVQSTNLKKAVADCNMRYIEKIAASERDRDGAIDDLAREAGPQGQLNRIIAALDFSD